MRSSMLLSALCAAGALATPLDKRVYVTDWTVVTVTTTITADPAPAPTTNSPVQHNVQTPEQTVQKAPSPAPQPTHLQAPPQPLTTSDVAPVQTPADPAPAPAPTNVVDNAQGAVESVWTTAWTSSWSSAWTSPATPTTMASTTQPQDAAPTNAYQHDILYNHNVHRSNHSADSIAWSPSLEASAHTLAARCVYHHDTSIAGGGYGQNIGYGVSSNEIGKMISNLMYNDEFGYYAPYFGSDPSMSNFDSWGHFTQIVWKDTKHVGCSTVVCNSLGNVDASEPLPFTVCNYDPPGNYAGEYVANVGLPQGAPVYSV